MLIIAPRRRHNSDIFSTIFGDGRVVRWCWVNFQCRGVLLIWLIVGQEPTALAVGAGGGCLDIHPQKWSTDLPGYRIGIPISIALRK